MAEKYSRMEWCCIQKNGIKLIEPNEILGRSYLDAADSELKDLDSSTLKIQNSAAYSSCYNSFYSILQKIGIKCEIHECSFEFFSLIDGFSEEQKNLILTLGKNLREIEQKIKKPKPVKPEPVIEFVETSKNVFESLSSDKIRLIRQEIASLAKKQKK